MKQYGSAECFGIAVKFKQSNGWSTEYTYLSSIAIAPDSLVVVPNNLGFVAVARVKSCTVNFMPDPSIKYKNIIEVLQHTFKDLK